MPQNQATPTTGAMMLRGASGRCPRCGQGRLFSGFLAIQPACERCGLDYGFIDSGDGPAVFVIFIAGFIVAGAALVTEALYAPPFWVHALLCGPLAVILCVLPLRPLKGAMIALQYHFQAAEHRAGGEDR
jgi:uncharacterized protein (DUF983 family)